MKQSESQRARAIGKRSAGQLNSKLEKNLLTYVAAASAAGVGMLASPKVEAKIVYTPANQAVAPIVSIDLNHDGFIDYNLILWGAASIAGSFRISYLQVCHDALSGLSHQCISSTNDANAKNVVREGASGAMALPFGAPIGPGQSFKGTGVPVLMGARIYYSGSNTQQKWEGPWVNGGAGVTNRYLGLKFQIDGKWHFGWARLTLVTTSHDHFKATVTGYAYETVPNTRIRAGQTTGTAEIGTVNPSDLLIPSTAGDGPSLGSLAWGAPGLSVWRREENLSK